MTRVDDRFWAIHPRAGTLAAAGQAISCFLVILDLTAASVLAWMPPSPPDGDNETVIGSYRDETEIKAAFVLNFIRLVNWASIGTDDSASELPICALGNSDFATSIRRVVVGKTVGTRSLCLRFLAKPDPAHCRVLILDEREYPYAQPALDRVRNAPVLTIGNGPGLIPLGGMFELIVEEQRVQFDANLAAVRRSNLAVSARLLQLSRNLRKRLAGVH